MSLRTCCCGPKIATTLPTDAPRPFAPCPSSLKPCRRLSETAHANGSWDLYQDLTEQLANALDGHTQHPLSRYKINTGGDWRLPTEILHATAVLATSAEQAKRVEQRLLPHLTHPEQKPDHGRLQAQTVLTLDRLPPTPTSLTATHPSPLIRQTAVICWGRADHRDPSLARVFAEDSNTGVRHNLARTLAELPPGERLKYETVTERLRTDNSARVRRATALIP
ncbi:HEAT repeat domain-containing protein [Streptomyces sp. G5(2025)]|uniref:HEAT repeat domain-containing protein n=1 Tax=Streptomyces sp. G5(2025) TaxID=3406628 RepID=UPI003C1ACDE1